MPTLPFKPPGTGVPTEADPIPADAAEYDEGGAASLQAETSGDPQAGAPEDPHALAASLPGMKTKRKGRTSRDTIAKGLDKEGGFVRVRDKQILALRVAGAPLKEIQERFGISRMTVHRALTAAQKRAFQDFAIDKTLEELVPKALAAVCMKLDEGDSELAVEVLKGIGIFGKHINLEQRFSGGTVETFEQLRTRIVRKSGGDGATVTDRTQAGDRSGDAIEADFSVAEEAADQAGDSAAGYGDSPHQRLPKHVSARAALPLLGDDEEGLEDEGL
jgi:hypothetical protein